MKSHRGLSAVVGTVFLVAVVISALSYVSYSLDTMGNFSESLIAEESRQKDKQTESFEISSIDVTPSNKLDGVIKNTGEIPVKITTVWIDEQGVNDVVQKFNVDADISPGNTVNLNSLVDFTMDSAKGYNMKVVTSRGQVDSFYVNSLANENIYMSLTAAPNIIPSTFSTTLTYTVVNNMSNGNYLYNLTPVMNSTKQVLGESSTGLTTDLVIGPSPASYESLGPGEVAVFTWIYELTSETDLDTQFFNVTLANANPGNEAITDVKVKSVPLATEAGSSITSLGVTGAAATLADVLYFHVDNGLTPNGEFPMDSASPSSAGQTIGSNEQLLEFISAPMVSDTNLPLGQFAVALNYFSNPVPLGFPEPSFAFFMDSKDCGKNDRICDMINLFDDDKGFKEGGGKPEFSKDGGAETPGGGPDGDEYFHFDTGDYFTDDWNVNGGTEKAYTEPQTFDTTTALWVKIEPTGNTYKGIITFGCAPGDDCGGEDTYYIAVVTGGELEFGYDDDSQPSSIDVTCKSTAEYDDDQWHHVVAVRDGGYCELYVDGQIVASAGTVGGAGSGDIDLDRIDIGRDSNEEDWDGDIASVIHWNQNALSADQIEDLYYTNYGINGTRLSMKVDITNVNGTFKSNVIPLTEITLPFHDPTINQDNSDPNPWLGFHIANTTDLKYSQANMTATSTGSNSTLLIGDRLKLTLDWNGKDEQNLPINIMFDDSSGWSLPGGPSYLQTPPPEPRWPSFLVFDSLQRILYSAFNDGPDGIWFVYSGTRVVLTTLDGSSSYSAVPEYVNKTQTQALPGCNDGCRITAYQDSIYIPDQYYAEIEFFPLQSPPANDDTPCTLCEVVTGQYDAAIYLQGYTESGETFKKTVDLGLIQIIGNP